MFSEYFFRVQEETSLIICERTPSITTAGLFAGENPLESGFSMLLAQMISLFFAARMAHAFLRHLGLPAAISYVIGGLMIGPCGLGRFVRNRRLPYSGTYGQMIAPQNNRWLRIINDLSEVFFSLVIGVKTDISMLRRSGKKSVAIAIIGSVIPLGLTFVVPVLFQDKEPALRSYGLPVGVKMSTTSFIVIGAMLEEFQMLTSKLGRLSMSAALLSNLIGLSTLVLGSVATYVYNKRDYKAVVGIPVAVMAVIAALHFGVRPVAIWMMKQTTRERELSKGFFITVILATIGFAFFSEVIGFTAPVGVLVLGLFLPEGPPLGSALVQRLDRFVTGILIPISLAEMGARVDCSTLVQLRLCWNVVLLSLVITAAKVLAVLAPCLYCKIPVSDGFLVAMMLTSKGISEMSSSVYFLKIQVFTDQTYAGAVFGIVLLGSITAFLLKHMYKPSMRFISYRRRTIQHSKPGDSLRVLVAVHGPDDTPYAIRLLDTSNPSDESAIHVYVLQLVPLIGHSAAVLAPLWREGLPKPPDSDRIAGTFALLERRHPRSLVALPYVSMAPQATMHDDVCAMALDKKAALVLLPFHGNNAARKTTCLRVLSYAPCSVGILVDHGPGGDQAFDNVGVFFLGGADDREALAYASRIAQGASATVTVVRFRLPEERRESGRDEMLDDAAVRDFRGRFVENERVAFREEVVQNGPAMVDTIRMMCDSFGLVMVGRRDGKASMLTMGLEEWSEHPELGILGDMLASADFEGKVTTLVLQQQKRVGGRASRV